MKTRELDGKTLSDVKTIGDVKAPIKVWGLVNSYKTRERVRGRNLNMPEALLELAEIGAKQEGIE
jgi:hypothetical protein